MRGLGQFRIIRKTIDWVYKMKMLLGTLYNEPNNMAMLALLGIILQYALGLMLVLFFVTKEMLLRCIGENEEIVVENIAALPISEALKEQLGEQMHCIARYYREKTNR